MDSDRREFLGTLGAMLASLVMSGRAQAQESHVSCYYSSGPPSGPDDYWKEVRQCWLDLKSPMLQGARGSEYERQLIRRHSGALANLVGKGGLKVFVANDMDVAFAQAAAHIRRQLTSCYEALPPEFAPRQDLLKQAEALTEMAAQSRVDPAAVRKVEEALRRDMEWLSRFARYRTAGRLEDMQPSPEAAEAARRLIELLTRK